MALAQTPVSGAFRNSPGAGPAAGIAGVGGHQAALKVRNPGLPYRTGAAQVRLLDTGHGLSVSASAGLAGGADYPDWSLDGRRLAFASGPELIVLDVRRRQARSLVSAGFRVVQPSWSPDGSELIYTI